MKIEINLKIVIALILSFIINNIQAYIAFLIFVLIHEIAHLIIGIYIGGIPKKLALNPLGVSLELYLYGKIKTFKKIIFYLSGPIINLIIAFVFFRCVNITYWSTLAIYTNLAICFFNLIPILPLDGGKIVKEVLKVVVGAEKSNKYIFVLSKLFLIIITFIYSIVIIKVKNIYILLLIIYMWYIFYMEEKKYYIYEKTISIIKGNKINIDNNLK